MKRKAFTLQEILLAMAIVGIVAGSVMSIFKNINVNPNEKLLQKHYAKLTKTISNLINDETIYPDIVKFTGDAPETDTTTGEIEKVGFEYSPETNYFCKNFVREFAVAQAINDCSFNAKDGSTWTITEGTPIVINVDVDGTGKGYNSTDCTSEACDTFVFNVTSNGRISISADSGNIKGQEAYVKKILEKED